MTTELSLLSSNNTQGNCFIAVPVLFLIGEQSAILVNIIANVSLMLTATLGNFSILLSFALVSSLHSTSNYLLFGLALTDLAVGIVVHPLYISVLYSLYNNSTPHCHVVAVYSIATSALAGISLLYITIIGADRYLAIRLNLRYKEYVTEKRINITQIVTWVTSALLSLVWLEGFHVYSTFAAVIVAISLLLTFAVYTKLCVVVRRHKAQIRSQEVSQLSQVEISRLKKLRKSSVNTMYVFFTFLLCYLPFFVATAINNMSDPPKKITVIAYEFTTTLMLSNSSLNPLMYCLRLREFRSAVKKTYCRIFCLDSHNQFERSHTVFRRSFHTGRGCSITPTATAANSYHSQVGQ